VCHIACLLCSTPVDGLQFLCKDSVDVLVRSLQQKKETYRELLINLADKGGLLFMQSRISVGLIMDAGSGVAIATVLSCTTVLLVPVGDPVSWRGMVWGHCG